MFDDCPLCGTWKCDDCKVKLHGVNRYYTGQHRCGSCGSENGEVLPVRHRTVRKVIDHLDQYVINIEAGIVPHYPRKGVTGVR